MLLLLLCFQVDPTLKAKVLDSFASLDRFEVVFRQESVSDFFEPSVAEGLLQVDRPGRMRMTYRRGDRKTFIWDGQNAYEHDQLADTENWTPQEEVRDEPLVQLLLYGADIDQFFLIDRFKGEVGDIYRLRPRQDDSYHVELQFDETWQPTTLSVISEDGEATIFTFQAFDRAPSFSEKTFQVPEKPED